jgi:hypothetical protein
MFLIPCINIVYGWISLKIFLIINKEMIMEVYIVTELSESLKCLCRWYEEIKPTRCYTTVYWTYDSLNMLRALLRPSSGAWDHTDVYSMWHIAFVIAGRGSGAWLLVMRPGWGTLLDSGVGFISSYHRRCTDKHSIKFIYPIYSEGRLLLSLWDPRFLVTITGW